MSDRIGRRIIVIGSSGSGKSTLGKLLAARLGAPFVDLDALNWEPGWVAATDEVFHARIRAAAAAESWVIAGNYTSKQQHVSWPLADTVVWLDLPLAIVMRRTWLRTWGRWRRREELWNGNRENMREHLSFWDRDKSILSYTLTTHRSRRRLFEATMRDPRWAHITFVRLRSPEEVSGWLAGLPSGTPVTEGQAASQPASASVSRPNAAS